jgi:hypothetical protein
MKEAVRGIFKQGKTDEIILVRRRIERPDGGKWQLLGGPVNLDYSGMNQNKTVDKRDLNLFDYASKKLGITSIWILEKGEEILTLPDGKLKVYYYDCTGDFRNPKPDSSRYDHFGFFNVQRLSKIDLTLDSRQLLGNLGMFGDN